MTLTEEQRAELKRVAAYMDRMYAITSQYYGCTEDANLLRAMIDSGDHFGEPNKMIGFDLERARGLRDFLQDDCAEVGDVWGEMIAEIERLRAELARVNQLREIEIDQAGASERIYREAARLKDARIKELEDALVEKQTALMPSAPRCYADARRQAAIEQLQAEGKIGSSDHSSDVTKKVWQITEERKEAIRDAEIALRDAVLDSNDPHCWDAETAVLRAMLEEAA